MTNVQSNRRRHRFPFLLTLILGCVQTGMASHAAAQEPFLYSRTPVSGGASEVMQQNRRSFGMNFRGGHTAGDSVGRTDGITHVSLSPYFNAGPLLWFADTRLGRGNQGGLTWGFGGGFRTFIEEWDVVTGINAYHSRDDMTGTQLRTWGAGVDLLAPNWEVRANYVRPNGEDAVLIGQGVAPGTSQFSGNNITFTRVDTIAEALAGGDVEGGVRLPSGRLEDVDLWGFFGIYRYDSPSIEDFTGWKTRLQADVGDHLELGLWVNQDTQFDTTVGFNATLNFGGFKAQDYTASSAIQRLADPVRRNINVAAARTDIFVPNQVAIDPRDNQPFFVVHVDENNTTAPFQGTVDNPLTSLTGALATPNADIIFVHAGGVYDTAPDNLVTVPSGVRLLGEGLVPTVGNTPQFVESTVELADLGTLVIPESPTFLASGRTLARPTLRGAAGDAVTMLRDSEFGGFIVDQAAGAGITTDNEGNTFIHDVLVSNSGGDGIFLQNTTEATRILDTVIENAAGAAFHVDGGNGIITYGSTRNGATATLDPALSHIANSVDRSVLIENMGLAGSVSLAGTTITHAGGNGVEISNNASDVTIDNLSVSSTTGNGILIQNSSGIYVFENSVRATTTIANAASDAILIDGLTGTDSLVLFRSSPLDLAPANGGNIVISNWAGNGINMNNIQGRVEYQGDVSFTGATGAAGSAVLFANSSGDVLFGGANRNLNVVGSLGRGIEISANTVDSSFIVRGGGAVQIQTTSLEGIFIDDMAGTVQIENAVAVNNRLVRGIQIEDSSGTILFEGITTVSNEQGTTNQLPAVDLQRNSGLVSFEQLTITEAHGDMGNPAGLNLVDNVTTLATGGLRFGALQITTQDAAGIFGRNNTRIEIGAGTGTSTIETEGGAALDLGESGWTIELDQLTAANVPLFGVRLFNAAPTTNALIVGSGSITGSAGVGVTLANAGTATFLNTRIQGIAGAGIVVSDSGLQADSEQGLVLNGVTIEETGGAGISGTNLLNLIVTNTLLRETGEASGVSVDLVYTERINDEDQTDFDESVTSYVVQFDGSAITEDEDTEIDADDNFPDRLVRIRGLAGAEDAQIDVLFANTEMTRFGETPDSGVDDSIFELTWDGPIRAVLTSNALTTSGGEENVDGIVLDLNSLTDQAIIGIQGNTIAMDGDRATGLILSTAGPSLVDILDNQFVLTGTSATGMELSLPSSVAMVMSNNTLQFDGDGGTGILFNLVQVGSGFTINGNQIALTDTDAAFERGIIFQAAIGQPNLFGNVNNAVFLQNPDGTAASIETPFSVGGGQFNGQIIVNGALVP